jgi:hypothetical protein
MAADHMAKAEYNIGVRFQVLTDVVMKSSIFWDKMLWTRRYIPEDGTLHNIGVSASSWPMLMMLPY